jgi:hypothetical protein
MENEMRIVLKRARTRSVYSTISLGMVAAAMTLLATVSPSSAMQIPYQTPSELKFTCTAAGGTYGPPSQQGVYTCLLTDGNAIACGGQGKNAKTCSNPARIGTTSGPMSRGQGMKAQLRSAPKPNELTNTGVPRPVVRDHRGGATGGGVTVTDTPVVRDQRDGSTATGVPVVRDHRGGGAVIRDHRDGGVVVRDHRGGATGGGVTVTNNGGRRRPPCLGNLC